ncbi:single-stranded-DNA-specific exonuclease RecJ [Pontiella sulfatireligans]|uniref:Single-stranded-DNA-specific exonuclease RecJ n=1 Tax=Pontiella sulfatireligans TaxID=2750658 RepID=A0A6C2UU91_9BACT|nr:single-stranded-DNA-specific exonuclease RecJ [Pontiella sulfatireligans]VGO22911.1 Single-stranded-DNA-specific exonuclease RecJ [Pontiella sulfatireligans]
MPKLWKTVTPVDEDTVRAMAAASRLPEPIARVLVARGFRTMEEASSFLNPRLADLAEPFELPDMEKAVVRIWKAIDAGETITVFGDYDVDGVTSTALLTRIFGALGADVKPFIPDRLDEGYGLSQDALARCLAEHGSTLVVSVDCGVNSVESVTHAQEKGIDVIVTDHHEPDEQTAPAFALINPKLGGSPMLKNLSGVGVAFKLAHALVKFGRAHSKASAGLKLRDYLDIVALGTVADIVPLVEENRIIVRHGLAQLNASKWVGLRALKEVAGVKGEANTFHLGFQLGPRINAAGRIGQPMQALRLLVTDSADEARNIATLLDGTNRERQRIEREMADEAFAEIDAYFDPGKNFGLVVAREGWHPGVVGIVASRVSRHYHRPAIVMGIEEDGSARGSCRSVDEYNLLDGLEACESLLNKFGGHKMAAGLEVKSGSLEAFKAAFNQEATATLRDVDLAPVQRIDAEVEAGDLDWDFLNSLKQLRPFGQNNAEPVWALHGVQVSGTPRIVGQTHLKLSFVSAGRPFDAIAFNYPLEQLPQGLLDVAFTLKENNWNGSSSLQLQVQDIRAATEQKPV